VQTEIRDLIEEIPGLKEHYERNWDYYQGLINVEEHLKLGGPKVPEAASNST